MSKKNIWDVEEVRSKRVVDGKPQYLLKWKGYPESANTWEPLANINGKTLISEYERKAALKELKQIRDRETLNDERAAGAVAMIKAETKRGLELLDKYYEELVQIRSFLEGIIRECDQVDE